MLPVLYGIDSKGKERLWKIKYENDTITVEHGCSEKGSKLVTSSRTFSGKNIGRKNETSPEEQARIEAEKSWINQVVKKQYRPKDKKSIDLVKKITEALKKQNNVITGLHVLLRGEEIKGNLSARKTEKSTVEQIKCTLAQQWSDEEKCKKYFQEGCWVQPKLDGVRVVALLDDKGKAHFISRGGKEYPHLSGLRKHLEKILKEFPGTILDGELYADSLYADPVYNKSEKVVDYKPSKNLLPEEMKFDVIAGIGKPMRTNPHPLEDQLKYYVFDIVCDSPQSERFEKFSDFFKEVRSDFLVPVKTVRVKNLENIYKYHQRFCSLGYEGTIIRGEGKNYEYGKKSLWIRKLKDMNDQEFEILGIHLDPGVDKEFFVFKLQTLEGKEFKAKPMGSREKRLEWYHNREELIGSFATVKYQKMSKEKVPIFGVVKAIRENI